MASSSPINKKPIVTKCKGICQSEEKKGKPCEISSPLKHGYCKHHANQALSMDSLEEDIWLVYAKITCNKLLDEKWPEKAAKLLLECATRMLCHPNYKPDEDPPLSYKVKKM